MALLACVLGSIAPLSWPFLLLEADLGKWVLRLDMANDRLEDSRKGKTGHFFLSPLLWAILLVVLTSSLSPCSHWAVHVYLCSILSLPLLQLVLSIKMLDRGSVSCLDPATLYPST